MNITDVGHMTSDEEAGDDKIEKRAEIENRTPWEIARFYEEYFFRAIEKLNILPPHIKPRFVDIISLHLWKFQAILSLSWIPRFFIYLPRLNIRFFKSHASNC